MDPGPELEIPDHGILYHTTRSNRPPVELFELLRNMTLHDINKYKFEEEKDDRYCKEALRYLERNVMNPLKSSKSLTLLNGTRMSVAGEDDRLGMAKLLYYYVRDYITFPEDLNESVESTGSFRFMGMELPMPMYRFPAEAVEDRTALCEDKATALAALLKLGGYEVIIAFLPDLAIINQYPQMLPLVRGYNHPALMHTYILIKDEGWGIEEAVIEPKVDMYGNPIEGKWIILDPLYNENYTMYNPVDFGEKPGWCAKKEIAEGLIYYGVV